MGRTWSPLETRLCSASHHGSNQSQHRISSGQQAFQITKYVSKYESVTLYAKILKYNPCA